MQPWQARRLGFALGLSAAQVTALSALLAALYRLLRERDAQLIEINPLVVTADGALRALDAKLEVDDNALYRQAELAAARDLGQEDPREAAARAQDLSYISLSGDIGCMVNGAGLAMATLDLIRHHGGAPANFLDVGGTATAARVSEAFKGPLSDEVRTTLQQMMLGASRRSALEELMHRIHDEFEFDPGATTVSTQVDAVLERRLGIAARRRLPEPAAPRSTVSSTSAGGGPDGRPVVGTGMRTAPLGSTPLPPARSRPVTPRAGSSATPRAAPAPRAACTSSSSRRAPVSPPIS